MDDPAPAERPIHVPIEPGTPASVDRQQLHTVVSSGAYGSCKASEPFLIDCVIAERRPDKVLEVSFEQMFCSKLPDCLVVLHHTGNPKVLSNRRDFDCGNAGRNHIFCQLFPMSDEREDPVAFPSDRDGRVVDHVGNHVPVMFGSIAGGASIEAMMGGGQREQDCSLAMLGAH